MSELPTPLHAPVQLGYYRHFKGGRYHVIDNALHSETLEAMVIYVRVDEEIDDSQLQLWVRPASMFREWVVSEEYEYDGLRFSYEGPK